ncbi:MAG: transcription antitermination factor NusB [Planctomycetaceae bacterium]|nr:transcription antitermination factor NusB [Planctomycetaceae bacterium]
MSRRSRAREVVLQVLYQEDLNPDALQSVTDDFLTSRLRGDAELIAFARSLLAGVRSQAASLDTLLEEHTENWQLSRMAATDRNVLRLAAFEILHADTPGPVVIDEAVELARRFGTRQSSRFVNGVLDRVLRESLK